MIYRAIVTRVTASGVFVRATKYARDTELGPLEGIPGVVLAVGDRLLIGLAEGDTVAIIRRLP